MGNEASLEAGEGLAGPGVHSSGAPLMKPVNGAAAGAGASPSSRLAGGPPTSPKQLYGSASDRGQGIDFAMGGVQAGGNLYKMPMQDGPRHSQTASTHQTQIQASKLGTGSSQSPGQHASRRNLQVDFSSSSVRTGRSPSVSPDRSSAPTSPYSVPQIAPMPSSKLCPVCNTTELTNGDGVPNFNKCTQCQTTVCNQCGFNPNPHLTGVKEWLCLNCQMQRALGIDMTTPRSKSQQQIHSPSHQPKPNPIPQAQPSQHSMPQTQPTQSSKHQTHPTQSPMHQTQHTQHPMTQTQPSQYPMTQPSQYPMTQTQPSQYPMTQTQPSQHPMTQTQPNQYPMTQSQPNQYAITQTQPSQHPMTQTPPSQYPMTQTQPSQHPVTQTQPSQHPMTQTQPSQCPMTQSQPSHHPLTQTQTIPYPVGQTQPVQHSISLSLSKTHTSSQPLPHIQSQMHTQITPQSQIQTQGFSVTQRQRGQSEHNNFSQNGLLTQKDQQAGHLQSSGSTNRHQGDFMGPERGPQQGRIPHPGAVPLPGLAKAQSQSDLGHGPQIRFGGQPDKTRSAGNSPAHRATSHEAPHDGLTKLFGFGASLLNQASTLISVDPLSGSSQNRNQSGPQGTKVIFSDVSAGPIGRNTAGPPGNAKHSPGGASFPSAPLQKQAPQQQSPMVQQKGVIQHQSPIQPAAPQTIAQKQEMTCPLCKTAFNVGTTEPPNYRSCTQCQKEVCNLCGFNPTPHLLEKKEWLCLNCQTQRLMSGGLDPVLPTSPNQQSTGSPQHQQNSSKTQQPVMQQQKTQSSQQNSFSSSITRQADAIKTNVQEIAVPNVPVSSTKPLISSVEEQKETPAKHDKVPEKDERGNALSEKTPDSVLTPSKDDKRELQSIAKYYEENSKTNSNSDLSRSPQSLSDTGYSSDGISSSHSEITGLIQEEELKMSERGLSGHYTPPSPSELIKLESSMRPLLESKFSSEGDRKLEKKRGKPQHVDLRKLQSRSMSISPEDSDEDIEGIMQEEEDPTEQDPRSSTASTESSGRKKRNVESEEITDEEFMRRQILEMSADEDMEDEEEEMEEEDEDEDEGYGYKKLKKTQKHISDSGKEKRRLTYHSSSFEEESKTTSDVYKGSAEEDLMSSQGGLRRFKTIELNNTNSYSRDMELSNDNDLSLDREPELEMESLTGSPEERSRGDYSSTLPPTTSSYSSGISPTSISSMEEDSDSSPSRKQRLEDAKQQRKARHRCHGPLLPTIEDSSEEDELREEEELLREQEKMREVEQQRIRSTVRKTKRDKEELRAQRRRERSKTPPSNLSPIEDASPTEELRQAAEMEELHRSSCSEYSPSADSDGEGYDISSKLYKSGSEYNLPTFMSLYSPTEKPQTTSSTTTVTTNSSGKKLKSAEEVYEEMMRKAEMLQKQQKQLTQHQSHQYSSMPYQESDIRNRQDIEDEYDYNDQDNILYESEDTVDIYEEIRQTSQNISKQLDDQMEMDVSYSEKQLLDTSSAFAKLLEQSNNLLTPGTSPTQLSAPISFSETGTGGRIPDVRVTQHFSKDGPKERLRNQTGKNGITPTVAATTIAAYGVYARDTVTVSQTSTSQTVSTTYPSSYGRHSATTTSVSHKIAEITQAYNQRESAVRTMAISRGVQMRDSSMSSEPMIESSQGSVRSYMYRERSPPISPTSTPLHSPPRSPSKRTAEFSTQTAIPSMLASSGNTSRFSPVMAQGTQTPDGVVSLGVNRKQSAQDSHFIIRTEQPEPISPCKPATVNTATSPLSSPTRFGRQSTFGAYSPPASPPDTPPYEQSPQHGLFKGYRAKKVNVGTSMATTASMYSRGSLSMENISLCRISTVPGMSRIEQGQRLQSASVVDLRTGMKPTPIIMTDQGMDLTSVATESRKYSGSLEGSPIRQSTTIQPLIMNLNTQEHLHVMTSTPTTISVTVAASMFMSHPKHAVLYCDPIETRVDLGKDMGTVVCLAPNKPPPIDPSIPKIDAKLEDLSVQQQQLLIQQQKLQQQQQLLEQQLQQHHQFQKQQAASFENLNLPSQLPLFKKEMLVTETCTATEVNAISPAMASEVYNIGGTLASIVKPGDPALINPSHVNSHMMMVQKDDSPQGGTVTQLIKSSEGQEPSNFTSHIKSENQVTCCDVVYHLPFGGSCIGGPFSNKTVTEETPKPSSIAPATLPQLYQTPDLRQDRQTFQDYTGKSYTLPLHGRLQSSMSETNLADSGLSSYSAKHDSHYSSSGELFSDSVKDGYDGGYFGTGFQYGSFTDLRQGDMADLPMRRFNSLTNINSDYGYYSGDFAESNLAQYSATTAREISRMCAALNSIDRYSSNPDILQLGTGRSIGPPARVHFPQSPRLGLKYYTDRKPHSHSQALTDLINARQASLRAMYPTAIRSVDGMIYSTINTPIASTVPITTQPGSVIRPLLRGVYRPHPTPNMTPVPLASLTRFPIAPRTGQTPLQYPTPHSLPVTTRTEISESAAVTVVQDAPLYLGKSPVSPNVGVNSSQPIQSSHVPASSSAPVTIATSQPDMQPVNLSQSHLQTKVLHQPPQPKSSTQSYPTLQGHPILFQTEPLPSAQGSRTNSNNVTVSPNQEKETEERLHQQQEQLLQFERERVELEKLRQLRLQEELERERNELQRHREKEQILVQREIQELQTIKQQVLQQQQAERESQLMLQREQLAQQKHQLDQIQSLQQQLQQQLEEQKRQKTTPVTPHIANSQVLSDQAGRIIQPQELASDVMYKDVQVFVRPLPNSLSETCLRNNDDQIEIKSMRKQRSMPRLPDGNETELTLFPLPQKLVDCSVQTDDEDGDERYMVSRRRRTRRSVDCSVQTDDDEDKAEWEQPVRRRRSRYSRHSADSGVDHKSDIHFASSNVKTASSSIAIQTIRDCSSQTETEQMVRVPPSIHASLPDPNKVEIVHYISGPERTQKGQSLACQTEEILSQNIVIPQISIATTVSPTSVQLVGSSDQLSPGHQTAAMFGRRRPDPLEFGYQQHHLHNESLSSLIRQQPKSPQLKSCIAEPSQRHQAIPRPMKNVQRSLSDPKPLSPTTDENTKARIALYQQQALQNQLAALQQSSLLRKVKRTLPSPPPEETQLPMVTQNLSHMLVPSLHSLKGGSRLAAKTSLLKDLTHELKAVEQESTKLRKQQAELEEEEKEIDAKLRYLELGITQRKETLAKERDRRDLAYLRCMGDTRDYMSDSELNNLRLSATASSFESNGLLTRPSTAPLSHLTCELNTAAQFPPTSSFVSYQYPQSLPTAPTPQASTLQSTSFSQPPYPSVTQAQALPQPTPLQTYPTLPYQVQGTFPSSAFPQSQPPYPTDISMPPPGQPSQLGFQPSLPPTASVPYPTHSTPYPSQAPPYPVSQASTYQPQTDTLTFHQKPRQTSLADLEHKIPTNYEVISNPTVVVTTTSQDINYSQSGLGPSYGQYSTTMASTHGPYSSAVSNTYGGSLITSAPSGYGPYTTISSSSYGQYTTTIANTFGYTVTTASSYGQYNTAVTNTYGQAAMSDHVHSVDSPSIYTSDGGLYGSSSLEQNVPRNYVMIDDICELTKESMGTSSDSHRSEGHGRYGSDGLHTRGGSSFGRLEDERDADVYDQHHGRAYHLGQEETDWFEKPRGSRHYGSSAHSGRRSHVKHTYHDYDEPPEDLWTQDDYSHSRHVSSREHRHHSSGSSGRHSSRHSDEPRSSRSSRTSKDPSMRHDSRSLSSSGRRGESRSQGYHSSEYSRDPSGHHHSSRSGKQPSHHQGSSSRKQQDHPSSSRQPVSVGPGQKGPSGHSGTSRQAVSQPPIDSQQGQRTLLQQQAQTSATRPGSQTSSTAQSQLVQAQQLQAKPGQAGPMARLPTSTTQTTPASQTKPEPTPITAIGAKAVPQAAKTAQPPLTGIGSKAVPRPGGIGSAAAGQMGADGDSMLSKILPGGAAEQAGKLGEAISGFGKKFTSLW